MFWPGELELEEKRKDWYTLLNMQQGVMIPNDWETELKDIPFDGFFETAGGICLGSHSLKVEMDTLRSVLHHGMQDIRRSSSERTIHTCQCEI